MVWQWNVTDKAVNLAARVTKELGDITLQEPEQTMKNECANIVRMAVEQMPDELLVHVYAHGSQYAPPLVGSPRRINAFKLVIEEYVAPAVADKNKIEGATAPRPFTGAEGGPPTQVGRGYTADTTAAERALGRHLTEARSGQVGVPGASTGSAADDPNRKDPAQMAQPPHVSTPGNPISANPVPVPSQQQADAERSPHPGPTVVTTPPTPPPPAGGVAGAPPYPAGSPPYPPGSGR